MTTVTPINKVVYCLIANTIILIIIVFFVLLCASESKYFRFGPSDDFIIISVIVYNYQRYFILLCLITLVNFIKVIIQEIGEPILLFYIYNPDKKVIDDFTKNQLQFYGNAMFMVSNIRRVFEIMITITQIDIALYSVIVEQLTAIVTIRLLLNEKQFILKSQSDELSSAIYNKFIDI